MIIGITVRYQNLQSDLKTFDKNYIIQEHFLDISKEFGVTLLPICTSVGLSEIAEICDGVIVTGSAIDIDPSYYGGEPFKVSNEFDEYALDKEIIKAFSEKNKPILGICGGMQALNVFFGGTLKRNVQGHFNTRHKINIKRSLDNDNSNPTFYNKLFEKYYLKYEDYATDFEINSYHYQSVDKLGKGMYAIAHSQDKIIEVISSKDGTIIGVQYHPEVNIDKSESNKEGVLGYRTFSYFFFMCDKHGNFI